MLTGPASDISQTGATLTGTIDPGGQPTTYVWELGTTTAYGTSVYGSTGEGPGLEAVTLAVTGLLPGTTYHYRLVATTAAAQPTARTRRSRRRRSTRRSC